jgi:hypothetical protein
VQIKKKSLNLAREQCIELDNIGTRYATSRKVAGSISDEVIEFFNLPIPSSRPMALGGIGRPPRKADNLTAICEPII